MKRVRFHAARYLPESAQRARCHGAVIEISMAAVDDVGVVTILPALQLLLILQRR